MIYYVFVYSICFNDLSYNKSLDKSTEVVEKEKKSRFYRNSVVVGSGANLEPIILHHFLLFFMSQEKRRSSSCKHIESFPPVFPLKKDLLAP